MSEATDFRNVSQVLTGEKPLDAQLSEALRMRLDARYHQGLQQLLATWQQASAKPKPVDALKQALDADTGLARVAKEVITCWYTGQFTRLDGTQDPPGTPQQYQAALVWKVIKAKPPSTTPGGYGWWQQHP